MKDSDLGIRRGNANVFPGLGLIRIGPAGTGAVTIDNSGNGGDVQLEDSATTLVDVLSISRGRHSVRAGAEVINYRTNVTQNNLRRGQITFQSFNNFLLGTASNSTYGDGINTRILRATDYSFFFQDDWKFCPKLILNLGLRYELDLPPYETRGALTTFDPALYRPSHVAASIRTRGGSSLQATSAASPRRAITPSNSVRTEVQLPRPARKRPEQSKLLRPILNLNLGYQVTDGLCTCHTTRCDGS